MIYIIYDELNLIMRSGGGVNLEEIASNEFVNEIYVNRFHVFPYVSTRGVGNKGVRVKGCDRD